MACNSSNTSRVNIGSSFINDIQSVSHVHESETTQSETMLDSCVSPSQCYLKIYKNGDLGWLGVTWGHDYQAAYDF